MSRMLLTILVFLGELLLYHVLSFSTAVMPFAKAATAPCLWGQTNKADWMGQWDEGPCTQFRPICNVKPDPACQARFMSIVDARCRIICWNNPSKPDKKECQKQYFKRVYCNV